MKNDPVPGAEQGPENNAEKKSWRERLTSKMPRIKINKRKASHYAQNAGKALAYSAVGVGGALAFLAWPLRTAIPPGMLLGAAKALEKSAEIDEAKAEVAGAGA